MVDENGNIVRFFVLPSASKQPRFRRRRWIKALRRENFRPNRSEFWLARHFTDGEPYGCTPGTNSFRVQQLRQVPGKTKDFK